MLLAGATSRSGDRRADLATDRLPNDSLSIEIALKDDHGRPASVTTRKPHRHAYHELIWNRRGVGQHLIDGRAQTIGRNTVTVVGRGQVHEFLGGTGMSGAIVRFGDELLADRGTVHVLSAVDFRHGGAVVGRHRGVGYERRSNSGAVSGAVA